MNKTWWLPPNKWWRLLVPPAEGLLNVSYVQTNSTSLAWRSISSLYRRLCANAIHKLLEYKYIVLDLCINISKLYISIYVIECGCKIAHDWIETVDDDDDWKDILCIGSIHVQQQHRRRPWQTPFLTLIDNVSRTIDTSDKEKMQLHRRHARMLCNQLTTPSFPPYFPSAPGERHQENHDDSIFERNWNGLEPVFHGTPSKESMGKGQPIILHIWTHMVQPGWWW